MLGVLSGVLFVGLKRADARPENITVNSSEIEPFSLGDKPESDERLEFYRDGEVIGGFNESGEPNIGRRF